MLLIVFGHSLSADLLVMLRLVLFSHDLDVIVPVLVPLLLVVSQQFLEGGDLGHADVGVELLQGLMRPRPHEGLDPFLLDFYLVDVVKLELLRAILIALKPGMRICRHLVNPFLCHPQLPLFSAVIRHRKGCCQVDETGGASVCGRIRPERGVYPP